MTHTARTKLADRTLPNYTKTEELINMITHIVGGAMGIVALILCLLPSTRHYGGYSIVGGAVFGASMIILYTMSSIYHGLNPSLMAKRVFQVFDHCAIYLLIAGTYTPMCLCVLRDYNPTMAWWIFGVIWAAAALGITLTAIDLRKFRVFAMICYLGMGWCIIITAPSLPAIIDTKGIALLLCGGVAYTAGAILYGLGSKHRFFHSVFHIFVLIGSLLHTICIIRYVL